jgi:hypothetical protein
VNRELTLSGGVGLGAGSYAKLTFVNRKLTGFVEDFLTFEGGSTTVEQDGEVLGTFTNQYFRNSDVPKRNYRALVLQTSHRLTDRWRVSGHWTLMLENDGNFEGEGPGTPGISSGIGDYPEVFVPARNFPEGHLNGFQRHKMRAWTTYDVGLGRFGHADLGVLWRFDSGGVFSYASGNQPLSAIQLARDPGYDSLPQTQTLFFGGRGTGFFESSSRFDLSLIYDVPVYKKLRPWFKAEVRNVFNDQSLLAFNTTVNADPASPLDADGLPTGYVKGSRFGQGTSKNHYPVQRTFQFSVGFRF